LPPDLSCFRPVRPPRLRLVGRPVAAVAPPTLARTRPGLEPCRRRSRGAGGGATADGAISVPGTARRTRSVGGAFAGVAGALLFAILDHAAVVDGPHGSRSAESRLRAPRQSSVLRPLIVSSARNLFGAVPRRCRSTLQAAGVTSPRSCRRHLGPNPWMTGPGRPPAGWPPCCERLHAVRLGAPEVWVPFTFREKRPRGNTRTVWLGAAKLHISANEMKTLQRITTAWVDHAFGQICRHNFAFKLAPGGARPLFESDRPPILWAPLDRHPVPAVPGRLPPKTPFRPPSPRKRVCAGGYRSGPAPRIEAELHAPVRVQG